MLHAVNRRVRPAVFFALPLCLALASAPLRARAATAMVVPVTPLSPNGWTLNHYATGTTGKLAAGPDTPPLGAGSLHIVTDAVGSGTVQARCARMHGVPLAALTELKYSTFVSQASYLGLAPYLMLSIDVNGDAAADDVLYFEPVYQGAWFFPEHPQHDGDWNTWQTWDALNGAWWSSRGIGGLTPASGVKTLAAYLSAVPGARIVNAANGLGGLRVAAGGGAGTWSHFSGSIDAVVVGVNGTSTAFDFEDAVDTDRDGVLDSADVVLRSNLCATVDTGCGPTSVKNAVNAQGCSRQDQVDALAARAMNHGQYVSSVSAWSNDLYRAGAISNAQRAELVTGAARSSIGK